MVDDKNVLQMIYDAYEEFSPQLPKDKRLEKSVDLVLYGETGILDSIELVNFIVAVEQKIQDVYGTPISIADEKAISQIRSPFRTIGTLSEYVAELIRDDIA